MGKTLVIGSTPVAFHIAHHLANKMGHTVILEPSKKVMREDSEILMAIPDLVIVNPDDTLSKKKLTAPEDSLSDYDTIVYAEEIDAHENIHPFGFFEMFLDFIGNLEFKGRFIFVSSDSVYELSKQEMIDRNSKPIMAGTTLTPATVTGFCYAAMEDVLVIFGGTQFTILRPSELYGPHLNNSKVNQLCESALLGKPLLVSRGARAYCSIFNLLMAIELTLVGSPERTMYSIINVADGKSLTEQGLANTINLLCNRNDEDIKDLSTSRSGQAIVKNDYHAVFINPDLEQTFKTFDGLKLQSREGSTGYDPISMVSSLQMTLRSIIIQSETLDDHTKEKLLDIVKVANN